MNASKILGLIFLGLALLTLMSKEPVASIPVSIIGVLLMYGNSKEPI